jgi:hypothetical protein
MANPTFFVDATAVAARTSEVPNASFVNGANAGGSNAPAIGVNAGGGAVVGTDGQFTLLDQAEAARTPQDSQSIGGTALADGTSGVGTQPVKVGTNSATGDGEMTATGSATLVSLATGWTSV